MSSHASTTSLHASASAARRLHRTTRSEYAAYAAILFETDAYDSSRLAKSLVRRRTELTDELDPARKPRDEATRWPSLLEHLPEASLRDAVTTFASAYIRRRGLVLPAGARGDGVHQLLPPDLLHSTTSFINQILVDLAGMRPPATSKRRDSFGCLGADAMLGTASLRNLNGLDRAEYAVKPRTGILQHRVALLAKIRHVEPYQLTPILRKRKNRKFREYYSAAETQLRDG